MTTHSERGQRSRRLADLRDETAELERRLDSVRMSLESELGQSARESAAGQLTDAHCSRSRSRAGRPADHFTDHFGDHSADYSADRSASRHRHGDEPVFFPPMRPRYQAEQEEPDLDPEPPPADWRTEELVSHGRQSSYRRRPRLRRKTLIIAAALLVLITVILVITLSGGGPSWPASVAVVSNEATRACQNPDVKSEPDQVNFACAPATRQILWVFALMTSDDNPQFFDNQTDRMGLEPITPDQGGQVAWSLNLHHPYNPLNPTDSLAVAARAINSIIGGATVVSTSGSSVVQPGLEASPTNCLRYTGSAAVTSHQGFPGLCARPVTPAGQDELVADVYQKWMVGATPQAAQEVAVLFANASNPGDAQVQAILRQLRNRAP
jgi:hypothetical protein